MIFGIKINSLSTRSGFQKLDLLTARKRKNKQKWVFETQKILSLWNDIIREMNISMKGCLLMRYNIKEDRKTNKFLKKIRLRQ